MSRNIKIRSAIVAGTMSLACTSCAWNNSDVLCIEKQGSFAVGGQTLHREGVYDNRKFEGWATPVETGQTFHCDHAVVSFQIPADAHPLPLVFVHGYGQSSRCWATTPDGREDFRTLMLRKKFATYLVDLPGRGNAARTSAEQTLAPKADEQLWFDIFRIGEWPKFNPGVQFPQDAASLDQFFRQMTLDTSAHSTRADTEAIEAVLARIGASVLVTHSAGGLPGWLAAIGNANARAVVAYEPGTYVFPEDELPEPLPSLTGTLSGIGVPMEDFLKLTKIPIVLYFGDYIPEDVTDKLGGENWRVRLALGRRFVETVNRHGGNATLVELPKIGIRGNTHFLMSDLNNDKIAALLGEWLEREFPNTKKIKSARGGNAYAK